VLHIGVNLWSQKKISNNPICTHSTRTLTSRNGSMCHFLQTSTSCGRISQDSLLFDDMGGKSVRTTLMLCSCKRSSFVACRDEDAATPVYCASRGEDFLGDISNLAAILTGFSSFSTWLLRVLLLPKTECVARRLFAYLQIWTFSS
jgi:hypothetical protein